MAGYLKDGHTVARYRIPIVTGPGTGTSLLDLSMTNTVILNPLRFGLHPHPSQGLVLYSISSQVTVAL